MALCAWLYQKQSGLRRAFWTAAVVAIIGTAICAFVHYRFPLLAW